MADRELRDYDKYLQHLEQQYQLPVGWLPTVDRLESGGNALAVSPKGAGGRFQLMEGTAKQYGVQDRFDPYQSAEGAAKYFYDLFKKYDQDFRKAAAGYNWGPGHMDRQGMGQAPAETRNYMTQIDKGLTDPAILDEITAKVYGKAGSPSKISGPAAPAPESAIDFDAITHAVYGDKGPPRRTQAVPQAAPGASAAPDAAPGAVPPPAAPAAPQPGASTQYPALGAFGELGEQLVDIGKTGLAAGISTGTAALGALPGTLMANPPAALAGGVLGSAAGREINKKLGLEPEGLGGDLLAATAPLVGPALGAVGRGLKAGGRALLEATPPGKLLRRTQALEAVQASETAMQQEITAGRSRLQDELDELTRIKQDLQEGIHTVKGTTRSDYAQQVEAINARMATAQQEHQAHVDLLRDTATRDRAAATAGAKTARQDAVTSAREYARTMPMPTDEEITKLYADVDQYKFTMPTTLLENAQNEIRKQVEMVQKFFPGGAMGERARLARAPTVDVPAEGAVGEAPMFARLRRFIMDQGGITAQGEELRSELLDNGKGLIRRAGQSLDRMAQAAATEGLIEAPDKRLLLEAMGRSRQVETMQQQVDALGEFFAAQGGELSTLPGEMTFKEAVALRRWLGQRIGSLQRATTPDAGEQLGAAKQLYASVQETLKKAAESLSIPKEARAKLQQADAAYKVKATTEAFGDVLERYITDGKFNAAGALDYLRKNKEGAFLRDRLFEIGKLDEVERTLTQLDRGIKGAAEHVGATQKAAQERINEAIRAGRAVDQPFKEELAALKARHDAAQAQLSQDLRRRPVELAREMRQLKQAQTAEETALKEQLATQTAAVPEKPWVPPLYMGGSLAGAGYLLGGPVGTLIAAPIVLARALMTPPGQRWVAKRLAQTGGQLDETFLDALGKTLMRESARVSLGGPVPEN